MAARIAFCITTLEPGGAERQLVELATRLPRDRFEPAVVVLRPAAAAGATGSSRPSISIRSPSRSSVADYLADRRIVSRRLVELAAPIGSPRSCNASWPTPTCWAPVRVVELGVPIVAGIRVAEQRLNGTVWLQRRTAPFVEKHVCVSQSVAEFAERVMRLPREKLVVIPNGVDVERFAGVEPIASRGIGPRAGPPDHLVRRPARSAKAAGLAARPHAGHRSAAAGARPGARRPGPLDDTLRRQADRLGVADRVHFVGWRPDVPRLLAAADLLVLTSACEGMPNVILEAMAAARPVVATEVHGVAELLGDDAAGRSCPRTTPRHSSTPSSGSPAIANLATRLGQRNRRACGDAIFHRRRPSARYAELYGVAPRT